MEETSSAPSSRSQPKQTVLIVAGLYAVAIGPLEALADQRGPQAFVVRFASMIVIGCLILAWCHYDSMERRQSLGSWLRILVVLIGVPALLVYLFKSRGFKQGLRSSGIALLCLLALFVINVGSNALSGLILGVY
jgi:hypothetical protein